MTIRTNCLRAVALTLLLLLSAWPRQIRAYSLLTHEQLIDLTWEDSIVPLLKSRYPNLTPAELDQARAYAYGGCVIQDMGYYPFGDEFFSDLTHYVRSGDFVLALFRNAHNANELAFAVGALSHYVGDTFGHSQAVNRAVPIEFPKLERRFGWIVNYAEGPHQHVRTEFAFDVDEIAHHRLAPLGYMRHIGIQVPVHQLALAFFETYGLTENFNESRGRRFNLKAYQFATRTLIPRVAYAETVLHRGKEPVEPDTPDAKEIESEAAVAAQLYNWTAYRKRKVSVETHLLAAVLWILPKVGPLSMVAVKGPTADTEADYMHSVVSSTTVLHERLAIFTPVEARRERTLSATNSMETLGPLNPREPLPNRDLDTGQVVKPGGYSLTDTTYAELLHKLTAKPDQPIPPGIKSDVEAYYSDPDAPIETKKHPDEWKKVQDDLKILEAMPTSTEAAPYPTYGELNSTKK
jgi:zinc dependent phospholipase C